MAKALLIEVLRRPQIMAELNAEQWHKLIACARRLKLLAYLAYQAKHTGVYASLLSQVQLHLSSAQQLTSSIHRACHWELKQLSRELPGMQIIVLKGAAYGARGLKHSEYRHTSDVDILLQESELKPAEVRLKIQGWQQKQLDEYDDNYYRQWAHEIPPMYNPARGTTLDIHHTLYPIVSSRVKIDADAFRHNKQPIFANVHTLSDVDMILHSAIHLFLQEDFSSGLRDIVDLKEMIVHFSEGKADFIQELYSREKVLKLTGLTAMTLYQLDRVLGFMPEGATRVSFSPTRFVVAQAILADAHYQRGKISRIWHRLLFIRGHMIKMPLNVLVFHAFSKLKRKIAA